MFFSHGNLSLFMRILNWPAKESNTFFVVRPVTMGKGVAGIARVNEGGWAKWTTWGKVCAI
jgi:hypothetical protein